MKPRTALIIAAFVAIILVVVVVLLTGAKPELAIARSDIVGGGGLVTELNRAELVDTNATAAVWYRLSSKASRKLETFSRKHLNQRVRFVIGTNVVVEETMYSVISDGQLDLFFPTTDQALVVQKALMEK
jgi:preprotein translocase subunit SecD